VGQPEEFCPQGRKGSGQNQRSQRRLSGQSDHQFPLGKARNDTHQSTTDPQSALYRKAIGQASKLCFGTQVLIKNRDGLCAAITVHKPIAQDEPTVVALTQVDEHRKLQGARIATVGADKAYYQKKFVARCRQWSISPHAACKEAIAVNGLDGRTTRQGSYRTSQRIRKRVEEMKSLAG
jgi:hypothetical protein